MAANEARRLKNEIYEQFARIGKAISSPKRLELLELLGHGERTVEVLGGEANLTVANTSRHLQILREARLVEAEKEGFCVSYRLASQDVYEFLRSLRLRIVTHQRLERGRNRKTEREESEPLAR